MKKIEQIEVLGKANSEEIEEHFNELLIGAARYAVCEALGQEVEQLCGSKYKPTGNENKRAGSAKGSFFFRDVRIALDRPRVRSRKGGKEEEHTSALVRCRDTALSSA